jgi:peroxiredoxin family protein
VPVAAIVLYADGLDRFYEAVSFAAGARAQGKTVLFFLRGPALKAYLKDAWRPPSDPAVQKGLSSFPGNGPQDTLRTLRDAGLRLYACSAWVRLLALDNGEVAAHVDAVVGLNAFLSQAEGGTILYL